MVLEIAKKVLILLLLVGCSNKQDVTSYNYQLKPISIEDKIVLKAFPRIEAEEIGKGTFVYLEFTNISNDSIVLLGVERGFSLSVDERNKYTNIDTTYLKDTKTTVFTLLPFIQSNNGKYDIEHLAVILAPGKKYYSRISGSYENIDLGENVVNVCIEFHESYSEILSPKPLDSSSLPRIFKGVGKVCSEPFKIVVY